MNAPQFSHEQFETTVSEAHATGEARSLDSVDPVTRYFGRMRLFAKMELYNKSLGALFLTLLVCNLTVLYAADYREFAAAVSVAVCQPWGMVSVCGRSRRCVTKARWLRLRLAPRIARTASVRASWSWGSGRGSGV